MLRPRAWNITELNMTVNGVPVAGPLVDFGLLMFHTSKELYQKESGPFFYLSKVCVVISQYVKWSSQG